MNKIVNFNREARRRAAKETRKQIDDLKKINKRVNSLTEVDFSELKVPLITVYYDTVDFPGQIVARVFEMNHPTNIYVSYQSMDAARSDAIDAGFQTLVPRSKDDDPHIVETYMR